MPIFKRAFDVDALVAWERDVGEDNAIRALFQQWVLPYTTKKAGLRLAVRDGYLNFYRLGQSVARLSFRRGKPQVAVHRAYVDGREADPAGRGKKLPQAYVTFDAEALAQPATVAAIPAWIATAETHAGDEKIFVDALCLDNPGVLDMEMALPADDLGGRRVSPRMDLVVAQLTSRDGVEIAFWEVKCAPNGELRATADYRENADHEREAGPRVIHQLRTYQRWFAGPGRVEQVETAYREAARIMLLLRERFGSRYMQSDENAQTAAMMWRAVATAKQMRLILPPGLVIDDTPHWRVAENADRYARAAKSFAGKHHDRLTARGITVVHYPTDLDETRTLPPLTPGTIIA